MSKLRQIAKDAKERQAKSIMNGATNVGTQEELAARADLLHALLHMQFVECLRALHAEGYRASITRDTYVVLECNGKKAELRRPYREECEVSIKLNGTSTGKTLSWVASAESRGDDLNAKAEEFAADTVRYLSASQ